MVGRHRLPSPAMPPSTTERTRCVPKGRRRRGISSRFGGLPFWIRPIVAGNVPAVQQCPKSHTPGALRKVVRPTVSVEGPFPYFWRV